MQKQTWEEDSVQKEIAHMKKKRKKKRKKERKIERKKGGVVIVKVEKVGRMISCRRAGTGVG